MSGSKNFYIDPINGNDSNNGSSSKPFKSFAPVNRFISNNTKIKNIIVNVVNSTDYNLKLSTGNDSLPDLKEANLFIKSTDNSKILITSMQTIINGELTLDGLTIKGSSNVGSVFVNFKTLNINNSDITAEEGPRLVNSQSTSTLNITSSKIHDFNINNANQISTDSSEKSIGLLYAYETAVIIKDSTFNNLNSKSGAVLYFGSSNMPKKIEFINNKVSNSTCSSSGCIIYTYSRSKEITIDNNTFENNTSSSSSQSGILFYAGNAGNTLNFSNNTIKKSNNTNVFLYQGYFKAKNNTFENNTSKYRGLAYFLHKGLKSDIDKDAFENNISYSSSSSSLFGGAIISADEGYTNHELNIKNSLFKNNTSKYSYNTLYGGAIHMSREILGTSKLNVDNCEFISNSAYQGGAIYLNNVEASISNSTFDGNFGKYDGGAIYSNYNLDIQNSKFKNNKTNGSMYAVISGIETSTNNYGNLNIDSNTSICNNYYNSNNVDTNHYLNTSKFTTTNNGKMTTNCE